jgi:CheY-like chemotaxis protein
MNSLSNLSVLLVEDEYLIALEAEQMLGDMGIKSIEIASTWDTAFKRVEEGRFDVAILDVNLNGQLSFPIAGKLSERGVPVVFASGYDLRERAEAGLEGVFVTKPYTSERLKEALLSALSGATSGK